MEDHHALSFPPLSRKLKKENVKSQMALRINDEDESSHNGYFGLKASAHWVSLAQ